MSHTNALRGVSASALTLVLLSVAADAQESLPAIDVGAMQPQQSAGEQSESGSGGAVASGPAAAHPPAEDNTTYRPENAMTALKTNTPIMNTPASIQVVPRAVLEDRQVTEISQAVNNVSGVIAADERQAGPPALFIRGFLTNTYYLDGVRMPASPTDTNQNMANVDRVEVLKGPASILYGRGEPGGLVNLVTKQPLEKPYTAVQQQIGSWGDYRSTLDTTGPLTKDNTLLYRLNVSYENYHDFIDFSHGTDIFVVPTLRWNIDEHSFLNVYLTYQHRALPFSGGAPAFTGLGPQSQDPLYALMFGTGGAPLANFPRSRTAYPPWSRTANDEIVFGYNWSHDLNENWNVKHRFQAQLTDFYEVFGGPFEWNTTDGIPFRLDQYGQHIPDISTHSYYADATLTGNFSTFLADHMLLVGSDYQHFDSNFQTYFSALPSVSALSSNRTDISFAYFDPTTRSDFAYHEAWWGAYLQDQIKLPYNIFVLAGARYDRVLLYDDVGKNIVTNTQRVTPRFGLLWRPIPEVSIYGSYLTNLGASPFSSRRPVKPETAQQWEVGVKTELLDKRLTATVAYYDLTKQNIATIDPSDPTQLSYVSIGEARNRGVELDVAGEILPGWKVIGGYSYIASIITKDAHCDLAGYANFAASITNFTFDQSLPGGCVIDNYNTNVLFNPTLVGIVGNEGKRLGGVPRHSGSIWTTYEIQDGDWRGLKFGGGVLSRSLAQGDNFNSFHTPGYATVGLMASYETKLFDRKSTFQINVNNLLDTRYYSVSYPSSFAVVTGTPRSVKGSIKVEF